MSRSKKTRQAEDDAFQEDAKRRLRASALFTIRFFGAGLLILFAVFGGVRIYSLVGPEPGPTAAIVDQLSLTYPNPDFAESAAATLAGADYQVDYYLGDKATVGFFRGLPSHGYDVLIFRAHAGRFVDPDGTKLGETGIFTSELYSTTKYVDEQRQGRLSTAHYEREDSTQDGEYFAIMPDFVRSSTTGNFGGAIVILMGCDVLAGESLAGAFIENGAAAVVGWDGVVSPNHTDAVTERLLKHLLTEELSVEDAVSQTMAELGPDPYYGSVLLSYPPEE